MKRFDSCSGSTVCSDCYHGNVMKVQRKLVAQERATHDEKAASGLCGTDHQTFSPSDADGPTLDDINAARELPRLGPLPGDPHE
jgi:hypothetical protein